MKNFFEKNSDCTGAAPQGTASASSRHNCTNVIAAGIIGIMMPAFSVLVSRFGAAAAVVGVVVCVVGLLLITVPVILKVDGSENSR